ncbi:hypothetical protein [Bradyrhizobium aeschynomenes]|uniref:hypothetical protein n=1 Tax=Bradyrhizobium aeschynomenes TaxID=2734909 RepID=UPI001FEF3A20|nr:hypothetical protein [Bradyrhizobium aeschynomenes]
MKKKITLQLSNETLDRLKGATAERCVNRALLVEKALERFCASRWIGGHRRRIGLPVWSNSSIAFSGDLRALNDTVALHARYHLALASLARHEAAPLSQDGDGQAASAARSEDNPRDHVTISQSSDDDGELPFGAPRRRTRQVRTAAPIAEVSWGVPAAGEGGDDPFRFAEGTLR